MWLEQMLTTIGNHGWVCFWLFVGLLLVIEAIRSKG